MTFNILQKIKIVVFPSPINKLVDKETIFDYDPMTIITPEDGTQFKVLRDIYNGDLLQNDEYQIFVTFPVLSLPDENGKCKLIATPTMEVDDFATLQGDNDLDYVFLVVND